MEAERVAEAARIEVQKKLVDEERLKILALREERESAMREERRLRDLAGHTFGGGAGGDGGDIAPNRWVNP
jgi:hypothetical protein